MNGNRLYAVSGIALLALLMAYDFWAMAPGVQPASLSGNLSAAINQTEGFLETANQSAYLIFYPNMTAAYGYLHEAINASETNPTRSYAFLNSSVMAASAQLDRIYAYRTESLYALIAGMIVFAVLLRMAMTPVPREKGVRRVKRRRKTHRNTRNAV